MKSCLSVKWWRRLCNNLHKGGGWACNRRLTPKPLTSTLLDTHYVKWVWIGKLEKLLGTPFINHWRSFLLEKCIVLAKSRSIHLVINKFWYVLPFKTVIKSTFIFLKTSNTFLKLDDSAGSQSLCVYDKLAKCVLWCRRKKRKKISTAWLAFIEERWTQIPPACVAQR